MGEQLEARKDEALTAVEEAIYGALKRADLLREVGPFLRQILALEALGAVLSVVRAESGQPSSVPSSPHETGLTAEQKARIEGLDSFGFVEWGDSDEAYLEALTNSGAGSRSDSEGEGLAARVERLAERMTGLARKQADEFGNYVSQGQFSADYKEGLASAYDDSAEALRSLLVPKEEA